MVRAIMAAAVVSGLAAVPSLAALSATGTVTETGTAGSGPSQTYTYSLSLTNTGDTTLGTYWYAWIPGQDYLTTSPTNITSPAGWQAIVTTGAAPDGFAIQWKANSAASYVPVGGTLSGFGYTGTDSPTFLAGPAPIFDHPPVTTTFVYSGAPFSDPGYRFVVSVVPEPATLGLFGVGGALALRRRRA